MLAAARTALISGSGCEDAGAAAVFYMCLCLTQSTEQTLSSYFIQISAGWCLSWSPLNRYSSSVECFFHTASILRPMTLPPPLLLILIFSLGYLFVPSEDGAELKMKLVRSLTLCITYLPTRAPLTQRCYCCLRIYYESAVLAFGNTHSSWQKDCSHFVLLKTKYLKKQRRKKMVKEKKKVKNVFLFA